jgi:hypothetical protein
MDVIDSSLDMLHQLSLTTKLGATSYNFLFKLVQATPEISRYSPINKRQRKTSSSVSKTSSPAHAPAPAVVMPLTTAPLDLVGDPAASTIDTLPPMTVTDDLSFDIDQFLAQNPFGDVGDPSALDMGGMEHIWDWGSLHLDAYSQQGPNA